MLGLTAAIDLTAGAVAVVPAVAAIRLRHHSMERSPGALILLSGVMFCLGQAAAVGVPYLVPVPVGIRHAGTLLAYPFLLSGLIYLPRQPLERTSSRRVIVGGLMVVLAAGAFSWYYLIGPLFLTAHIPLVGIVRSAYAVMDLWLIFALYLLSARTRTRRVSQIFPALIFGSAIIVLTDTAVGLISMVHVSDMPLAHLGRAAGFAVVGLAALWYASQATPTEPRKDKPDAVSPPGLSRYLLPYIVTSGVVVLLVSAAGSHGPHEIKFGTYVIGAFLIELVFVYQYLAWRELVAYVNRSVRLESQAAQDAVTGLPHHRTLVSALDRELERAHRYGHPCSLLFIDLDHFKSLNDSYGHQTGDAALREFATVVRTVLRGADTLGRWGGEEFVVILPESTQDAAAVAAERVRAAVAGHSFSVVGGGAHLTCSVGVSTYPFDARDRDGLVMQADGAMYAAKQLGRNQVRAAGDPRIAELELDSTERAIRTREDASLLGAVEALVTLAEAGGRVREEHIHAVATTAQRLGLQMGLDTSETHMLGLAAQLHDIGVAGLPDNIVWRPGELTPDEWTQVKEHAALGAAIVSKIPALRPLAPIIRFHHERWDGAGYPEGLAGETIPLGARILAVAEAYGSLTTDSPYRAAVESATALAEIQRHAGTQFDPRTVLALERTLDGDAVAVMSA